MRTRTILITGATGQVGRRVAELLATRGLPIRMMARDPKRLPRIDGAQVTRGDYADRASLDRAFVGIDTALLVSGYAPPGQRAKLHGNAIDAAVRARIGHLVYLSFQGASPESTFPMSRDHFLTEQHLERSGLHSVALRDNLYLDIVPQMFDANGVARGPAGNGAAAWIGRDAVALVAAAVLSDAAAYSGAYDVAGTEAVTLEDVAARLSALTGRTLRYENETVEAGRAWRAASGAPEWEVDTWLGSYLAIADGELAGTSDTVQRITGRPPATIETYFRVHPELLEPLFAHD